MIPEGTSRGKWQPARQIFTSFDRSYQAEADYFAPDRYDFWDDCAAVNRCALSRGAGLSYVAASFRKSGTVVDHGQFNRLLDFNSERNLLEVETGVSLGQIYDFAMQRGLFLPVQPGHPNITVGGCIGPDVHGKNQFRDGTFISCVESLRLFHPRHGILDLSPDKDSDLFRLTCGGYGLTGNILSARLRLVRTPSTRVAVTVSPFDNIGTLPQVLSGLVETADLLYSWHDFNARGSSFGNGFVVSGAFHENSGQDLPRAVRRPLRPIRSYFASHSPASLWNYWSVPVFNRVYNALSRRRAENRSLSLYDFLFPVAQKISYFHFFGKRGFHEFQIVLPALTFADFIDGIRHYLSRHRVPITLASAKLFRGGRDLLRFTGNGICLALDFPRIAESEPLLSFLDGLMCDCGGWPNLIKDSRLSAEVVARTYPDYPAFCQRLREFDPQRSYRSEMSDRLRL